MSASQTCMVKLVGILGDVQAEESPLEVSYEFYAVQERLDSNTGEVTKEIIVF